MRLRRALRTDYEQDESISLGHMICGGRSKSAVWLANVTGEEREESEDCLYLFEIIRISDLSISYIVPVICHFY